MLSIQNLHISIESKPIVNGVSLSVAPGEVHAIMGPNGSGKSTLAMALAGHPRYAITVGTVHLDEKEIHKLPPHERARAGLFLSFQYPMEIPGVSVLNFLRTADQALHPSPADGAKKVTHPGKRTPSRFSRRKKQTDCGYNLSKTATPSPVRRQQFSPPNHSKQTPPITGAENS